MVQCVVWSSNEYGWMDGWNSNNCANATHTEKVEGRGEGGQVSHAIRLARFRWARLWAGAREGTLLINSTLTLAVRACLGPVLREGLAVTVPGGLICLNQLGKNHSVDLCDPNLKPQRPLSLPATKVLPSRTSTTSTILVYILCTRWSAQAEVIKMSINPDIGEEAMDEQTWPRGWANHVPVLRTLETPPATIIALANWFSYSHHSN